jgi:hypothetical protein
LGGKRGKRKKVLTPGLEGRSLPINPTSARPPADYPPYPPITYQRFKAYPNGTEKFGYAQGLWRFGPEPIPRDEYHRFPFWGGPIEEIQYVPANVRLAIWKINSRGNKNYPPEFILEVIPLADSGKLNLSLLFLTLLEMKKEGEYSDLIIQLNQMSDPPILPLIFDFPQLTEPVIITTLSCFEKVLPPFVIIFFAFLGVQKILDQIQEWLKEIPKEIKEIPNNPEKARKYFGILGAILDFLSRIRNRPPAPSTPSTSRASSTSCTSCTPSESPTPSTPSEPPTPPSPPDGAIHPGQWHPGAPPGFLVLPNVGLVMNHPWLPPAIGGHQLPHPPQPPHAPPGD